MRVALDTNVLAYAEGVNGASRRDEAMRILDALDATETVVPVQALAELFVVLTRKAGRTPSDARQAVMEWADAYALAATSPGVLFDAAELAATHRLGLWDAIMLAAAAQADCRVLLSEDMQDGFTWRQVRVRNPFAPPR